MNRIQNITIMQRLLAIRHEHEVCHKRKRGDHMGDAEYIFIDTGSIFSPTVPST